MIETLNAFRENVTLRQWISATGNLRAFVGYARLLWPEFVIHDDCVFEAERFSIANYDGFMRQTGGNKASVEVVMNHAHIVDIFPSRDGEPSRELVLYAGRLLKETWQAKLARDFPDREFTVSFPEGPFDDPVAYEITFFQDRNK
jgi:hypothetical protein